MTPASVGVSNYCAMWSNAPCTIWTPATHHGIGVMKVVMANAARITVRI